jgi:hypothetical protein
MLSPSEFAYLIGVNPKWVHNAALRLKRPIRFSVKEAIRLSLARRVHDEFGIPLPRAVQLANDALHESVEGSFVVESSDAFMRLSIDMTRFLIAFNARLSWMRSQAPIPDRGRKPGPIHGDALTVARTYGLDISLIQANLRRSPAERLRALDENMDFVRKVQRRHA